MYKLKKINVWSMSKLYAILMAIMGLIFGIFYSITISLATSLPGFQQNVQIGPSIGFAAIILFPVMYGIIGLVAGALGALFYNLAAKLTGGLEIELDKK